jgi:hypothetical protein
VGVQASLYIISDIIYVVDKVSSYIAGRRERAPALNRELARLLRSSTRGAFTLEEASQALTTALRAFKLENSVYRLGFVAGIRESDGPEMIEANSQRLAGHTASLRTLSCLPLLFSCMDIYDADFLRRFERIESKPAWDGFYRRLFEPGLITHLFLTPRWENSVGTRVEYELAIEFGMRIYLVAGFPTTFKTLRLAG